MSRKCISLDTLSEEKVSWLYYASRNRDLQADPNVKLLFSYLKDIAPFVLTEYESEIFWDVTNNGVKQTVYVNKLGVHKSVVSRAYNRASQKLKPFARAFVKALKIKNVMEV